MKSILSSVNDHGIKYQHLSFICPGCSFGGPEHYEGLHSLPVNDSAKRIGRPCWEWNGDLEFPTLRPSILSHGSDDGTYPTCHSWLTDGVFDFLSDSTHPFAGFKIIIPDLPEWVVRMHDG